MSKKIKIFDTTLRDGEQSPGVGLSVSDKLEIARQLERLGVDVIEAGFPSSSQESFKAVKKIAEEIKGPVICALARATKDDIERAAEALKNCAKPRIHTFINASDVQIEYQLKKTKDEVLRMTAESVKLAKGLCAEVEFSPMDATRADFDFLTALIKLAIENGATIINIPDTVGYHLPKQFNDLIVALMRTLFDYEEITWSVHCHNDLGLATANSLAAISVGCEQIECTINGLGERAGNAALEEIVMAIDVHKDKLNVSTGIVTEEITKTSRLVSRLFGYKVQPNKAIVGANAFRHSSGIHQDGIIKNPLTFGLIDPARVGLKEHELVLGKTSGSAALRKHLKELGYVLDEETFQRAFARFKYLADKKAQITAADLEAIAQDEKIARPADILVLCNWGSSGGMKKDAEAWVELKIAETMFYTKALGDGQVDAIYQAINEAAKIKPELLSYEVDSVTVGTDAQGEVTLRLQIDGKQVMGRGVSTDIIGASAKAYLNAINVFLYLKNNSNGG